MEKTIKYIDENRNRFLDELLEFLKIPSISANPGNKKDLISAAEYLVKKLQEAGLENVEAISTEGNPVVYAEKITNDSWPTVLVYGHYDVQPPDPLELWESPPFEPVIKKTEIHPDGAIFARGACDDKGQLYMHVKAFEAMQATGEQFCNWKFMIEGEEEVGSVSLAEFVTVNKKKLSADVILISDTSIFSKDIPTITAGLRGLAYMEVSVKGPNRDLHSGVYGGAVANPANVLAQLICKLHNSDGSIAIPGFYDDVIDVPEEEREALKQIPFDKSAYMDQIGINDSMGEAGFSILEQTSIRPTLDVNGMWSGYTGEGAKTVLPSEANAKISMRLVPNQRPEKIEKLFSSFLRSMAPKGVTIEVKALHGGLPAVTPTDTSEYRAASNAMEHVFGKKPIPLRSGGSIPIVALFEEVLGIKTVLMGFGLDSDALHSPNEHFGLFNYYQGINTIPYFHKYYSELKQ